MRASQRFDSKGLRRDGFSDWHWPGLWRKGPTRRKAVRVRKLNNKIKRFNRWCRSSRRRLSSR